MKTLSKISISILVVSFALIGSQCLANKNAPELPSPKAQAQLKKAASSKDRANLLKVAKKLLSPLEYKVAFESGTERAFKNRYWKNKEAGIYVDIITGEALFSSVHKFKSGTGWPSFDRPLTSNVVEVVDKSHGMKRIEVRSKTSDIHLGHVFEDGPKKTTGRRFCINSASLRFIPLAEIKKAGYGNLLEKAELNDAFEKLGQKK